MLVKTYGSTIVGINAITITIEVNIDIGIAFVNREDADGHRARS